MHDVERHDVAALAPPDHRTVRRVAYGVAPHGGIEMGNANPHHPVSAIALRKSLAEHLVQLLDVLDARWVGAVEHVARPPGTRRRHQSAPAATASAYSSLASSSSTSVASTPACSTRETPACSS